MNLTFYNAIRSANPIQVQPIIPILIKIGNPSTLIGRPIPAGWVGPIIPPRDKAPARLAVFVAIARQHIHIYIYIYIYIYMERERFV